jgi:ABC-type glycerol-3-phosphate transport system substrate-binding protein
MQNYFGARLLAAVATAAGLAACSSTTGQLEFPVPVSSANVGGAPQRAVANCVNASARKLKVPVSDIVVVDGTSTVDGVYAINLKVGPSGRSAVCSVDDNGTVMGVVYKRPV